MARSFRYTPKCGVTTAASEKAEKRLYNRRLRRKVKQLLGSDGERDLLPALREVSDPWSMAKDGKCHLYFAVLEKPYKVLGK